MFATRLRRLGRFLSYRAASIGLAFGCVGLASLSLAADVGGAEGGVREALKARLPKTQVGAVDCQKVSGLCEITAGANLFYVDPAARYLIIGRVYDMQTRQDLTAAKLLEMNPDMLVGAAASANAAANLTGEDAQKAAFAAAAKGGRMEKPTPERRSPKLSLESLGKDGAIIWGNPQGQSLTIFTDFRCSYCRALSNVLRSMNVKVIERPISVLGSRDIADRVYCAKDKERAVHAAYAGEPLAGGATCDTSGLDANEAFAHKHGLNGTPVIVRSDGAVLEGYRPREFLEAWLKDARS
ncbi:DsbC family protein [Sphingobium sp. SA916]|uniref:DsbC family protein n=1 Tax=Sphingobium sp. SA916 TaxID=1851207 RepID=UPI000C9EE510|nr:DsbC family protein [Sphingobium sp. SA916]PNQ02551.1 disulfide bond formation protein DsbC [Sphingobium sp. SA916]